MRQKKSIFSLRLLWEGFRQCQMIGILSAVIMILGAVFVPVSEVLSIRSETYYVTQACSAWGANPILLFVLLAAPLMTLVLFHFLDTRAASDLYHSMPHKRIALYLSYAGAVLLWVVLLIVVSMLVSMLTCAIADQYIALLHETILPYYCGIFLICFLTISGMLIAMSLTGTVFTNILFSVILLFLPRFCITVLTQTVTGSMPFVADIGASTSFFQSGNNLLFSLVGGVLGIDSSVRVENIFSPSWQAIVYTLALGLIYFALGALMFCRRRSEAAGQSAPSRMLQHVYRIVVTMTYCIFVTAALHSEIAYSGIEYDWFVFMVLYIIAILIYCIYELITTKKWRNLLTALPGLAIVAVLNGAILLGMHVAQEKIIAQRPAVQEIESVSIRSSDFVIYQNDYLSYEQYVDLASRDITITDPTVISLVSYYLDENIKTWEDDGSDAYYDKYYNYGQYYHSAENGYNSYTVTIRTKEKNIHRVIQIPAKESETLISALQNNQKFVDAWLNPPEPVDGTLSMGSYNGNMNLEEDQLEALFQCYCEELKSVPFDKLYAAQMGYESAETSINYTFHKYGYTCTIDCPIYSDLMPKTVQKYYDLLYAAEEEQREALAELNQQDFEANFSVSAYGGTGGSAKNKYADCYVDVSSFQSSEEYQLLMKYVKDGPVQAGESYVDIYVYWYEDGHGVGSEGDETIMVTLPIDDAFFGDMQVLENYDVGSYEP